MKSWLSESPGWLFLALLLIFFPLFLVVDVLFSFQMDHLALLASVFLAALFVWVLVAPPVGPQPSEEQIEKYKKEHPRYEKNYGRTRMAGLAGGILFTILGYYAATRAHLDPERVGRVLDRANYRVFSAYLILGWGPYLAHRIRIWWERRKLEKALERGRHGQRFS